MFLKSGDTRAVPGRVYALCRLLQNYPDGIKDSKLKELMIPGGESGILSPVVTAAEELSLLRSETGFITPEPAALELRTPEAFKKHVIQQLPELRDGTFWQITEQILALNGSYLTEGKNTLTDAAVFQNLKQNREDLPDFKVDDVRAWRFWASYLGLGYTVGSNMMIFIPDASEFLRLLIEIRKPYIPEGEMSVSTFFRALGGAAEVLVQEEDFRKRELNLAAATALSALNEMGILRAQHKMDEKEVWSGNFYHTERKEISIISLVRDADEAKHS